MIAWSIPFPLIYTRYKATLKEAYLYDLALEYQSNFGSPLKDSHLESKVEELARERFGEKSWNE